jgi:prevent-host-death family protein
MTERELAVGQDTTPTAHPMPVAEVTMPLSDLRHSLSDIVAQVAEGERRIIVQKYDRPRVVILSFAEYERYRRLEECLPTVAAERFIELENQYAATMRKLDEERLTIRQNLKHLLPEELEQLKRAIDRLQRDLRRLPLPD